jgi:dihydrolipoamide dehydrogenase
VAERIAETIRVHPALSEVVQGAFRDACGVAPTGI